MQITETQIDDFKTSLFLHSLCEYKEDEDDFNMWRFYGQNGNGVGIIYEISNVEDKWYQLFLGKVMYDTNSDSSMLLKSFIDYHNSFITNHPTFINNIPTIISVLLLFHKNPIWSIEKEHRLFTYLSYEKHSLETHGIVSNFHFEEYLCHSIGTNRKENAYVRMPLQPYAEADFSKFRTDNEEKFLKTKPNITISKVVLGYNYSEKDYQEIGCLINRLCYKVFDQHVMTEVSKLAKIIQP